MLENSTLTCRMWRIHQRNISTDLQEDIFIDQNKYELYFWSYMAISTLFGNSFLGIIWHFERFGGDTQKRSLQNRLASQIIVACILLMNSANILGANMSYRFASYDVLMLYIKIYRTIHFILLDFIILHTLVVYLQVVVWKRLREFNEELIIRALWKSLYFGNLALSMLCPMHEKIELYFYLIGGSTLPRQSHVAETSQTVTRYINFFPNHSNLYKYVYQFYMEISILQMDLWLP